MEIEKYLRRIGSAASPTLDLQYLKTLHLLHLRSVPFENLDIHAGSEIVLREECLYEKIVERGRGGICYELNGLFAWLLRSLGFDVTILSANVYTGDADLTPDFDHMVLLIKIDQDRYLADVGFGDSFVTPLDFAQRNAQSDGTCRYKISWDDPFYTLSRINTNDSNSCLQRLFRFESTARSLEHFIPRCNFHQNSPESHFRRKIVCSRADLEGRITVSGDKLIVSRRGTRAIKELPTPEDLKSALQDNFGIFQ